MGDGGRDRRSWWLLCAAALGLLVLGRLWPGRLPGAPVGEDVLLVVSGALLVDALLTARDRGTTGRVLLGVGRELVPAALVVLAATAVAIPRLLDFTMWSATLRDVRAAATLTLDLEPVSAASVVQPFWLVALLVQAFVLVAIVVLPTRRHGARAVAVGLAVVLVVSLGMWVAAVAGDESVHAAARLWPVFAGGLAALWVRARPVRTRAAAPLGWLLMAAVAGVAFVGMSAPALALIGVAAAGLFLLTSPADPAPRSSRPDMARAAARFAWAAFLWSGPALPFARAWLGHEPDLGERVALLAAVLVLAVATVALVAGFAAVPGRWVAGPIWATGAVVLALVLAVASDRGLDRVAAVHTDIRHVQQTLLAQAPECFGAAAIAARQDGRTCVNPALEGTLTPAPERIRFDNTGFPECYSSPHESALELCDLGTTPDVPRVLVLGDSHARVMLGAFQRLADGGFLSVSAATKASCAWSTLSIGMRHDPLRAPMCDEWRQHVGDWLDEHGTEYDLIVTTAYGKRMNGPTEDRIEGLVEAWTPVAEKGVPILAIRDNPRMPHNPDRCLIDVGAARADECAVPREEALRQYDAFEPATKRVPGARFLDLTGYYCDEGECPAVIGGVGVFRDYNHVAGTYAASLAPWLYGEIAELGLFEQVARSGDAAQDRMSH